MIAARVLRWLAVAIAALAVIDPAATTARRSDAIVAVVADDGAGNEALIERVADELESTFTVVRGPLVSASATVLVGSTLPRHAHALASPVFAVLPDSPVQSVALDTDALPVQAPLNARVLIEFGVDVSGGAGRALEATLSAGDLVLDRATVQVGSASERLDVALTFVPSRVGPAALRVRAALSGSAASEAHDFAVDVRDRRWAVLFFEGRPAWLSTFVRRTIEQDPRFVVTSRTITSRGVSAESGLPPERLADAGSLAEFDAVIVGAPEALTRTDVDGLERYMRARGGSVLLLPDQRTEGSWQRLAGVSTWASAEHDAPVRVASSDSTTLHASRLMWPARLPDGAEQLAWLPGARGSPVIWSTPVGGGRLIVSGALDAWRFRQEERSAFERFWPGLIARAAAHAPAPLSIDFATPGRGGSVVARGAWVDIALTHRAALLADFGSGDSVRVAITATAAGTPLRVWPGSAPGRFHASFRAPTQPGTYFIDVATDGGTNGARARTPFTVLAAPLTAPPAERALVEAWSGSNGGATLTASQLHELPDALLRTLDDERRRVRWHPMRSPWWILPFAAALGGEWWLRRRRGLP